MRSSFRLLILVGVLTAHRGHSAQLCSALTADAEHHGITAPAPERLHYEEYQRETRLRLELEKRQPGADLARITKELLSLDHQESLIERTRAIAKIISEFKGSEGERSGSEFLSDFVDSVGDSDRGKILENQKTTWAPATEGEFARSDAFFDLITLRESNNPVMREAQKILETILVSDFDGKPGQGILNKRYSNQEIRDIVKTSFFLKGALHDLPGIYDAFVEYASLKDPVRFANRLRYNFSHNGPGRNKDFSAFWGALFKIILPGQLGANGNADFFADTIYTDKGGQVRYPEGSSRGWFIHTATDRMSGEINLLKFIAEAPAALDVIDIFASSYTCTGVIVQLGQLGERLTEVGPRWNSPQTVQLVREYMNTLQASQQRFAEELGRRVQFADKTDVTPVATGKTVKKSLNLKTLDANGQVLSEYVVEAGGDNLLFRISPDKTRTQITRKQFLDALSKEVFEPLRAFDPLTAP